LRAEARGTDTRPLSAQGEGRDAPSLALAEELPRNAHDVVERIAVAILVEHLREPTIPDAIPVCAAACCMVSPGCWCALPSAATARSTCSCDRPPMAARLANSGCPLTLPRCRRTAPSDASFGCPDGGGCVADLGTAARWLQAMGAQDKRLERPRPTPMKANARSGAASHAECLCLSASS
jgi:hypothetical protein